MGHFQVGVCLGYKVCLGAQLLKRKRVLFAEEYATHFQLDGYAPALAFKLRHAATRKWAIGVRF